MNFITVGFGRIDWVGLKSVLKHSAWIAGLSVGWYILSVIKLHDFGSYQMIATWAVGSIAAYLKKLSETYQVPVPPVA